MPAATDISDALRPLVEAPERAAVFCDVDGTLAPIVEHAELARVSESTARLLGELARRYPVVACISGRSATEARRLVGVGSLDYAGYHGAELLRAGAREPERLPELEDGADRVRRFATEHHRPPLRLARVRLEDKGPIFGFHWRGAPDEDTARARVEDVARAAEAEGLATHWGRKVLEVRPPVAIDKGRAVRRLVVDRDIDAALFGGDDRTDLDGFDALEALREEGEIEASVCIGVSSADGPGEIVERADVVVDGVGGFAEVLAALAEPR